MLQDARPSVHDETSAMQSVTRSQSRATSGSRTDLSTDDEANIKAKQASRSGKVKKSVRVFPACARRTFVAYCCRGCGSELL
uniref:Uncharacterized protein n=1 Tax=Parascaris equorum TaxID=6256 RepID=A0A914R356_PAREQ